MQKVQNDLLILFYFLFEKKSNTMVKKTQSILVPVEIRARFVLEPSVFCFLPLFTTPIVELLASGDPNDALLYYGMAVKTKVLRNFCCGKLAFRF